MPALARRFLFNCYRGGGCATVTADELADAVRRLLKLMHNSSKVPSLGVAAAPDD